MNGDIRPSLDIAVLVTPHFNVSATTSFVDPFRVANYLSGSSQFSWTYLSEQGGALESSSGLVVQTTSWRNATNKRPWLALVSTSWTPEQHLSSSLRKLLRNWAKGGAIIGGLDTGAIVLANAGMLRDKPATVHYEHIDAFIEIAPETRVTENLFVADDRTFT
jgi:AraC family carnitine catabolism transcriptional activator